METCGHDGCERVPTDMLAWHPSEMQVMDGGYSVALRCREHSVAELAAHLRRVDPQAHVWVLVMNGTGSLTPGTYLLSRGTA